MVVVITVPNGLGVEPPYLNGSYQLNGRKYMSSGSILRLWHVTAQRRFRRIRRTKLGWPGRYGEATAYKM